MWNSDNSRLGRRVACRYASSGVIFFNYTRPTVEVVEEWIRHVNFGSNVAAADDKQLDEVYNARWATKLEEKHMNVAWLPRSYLQFYSSQVNGSRLPLFLLLIAQ